MDLLRGLAAFGVMTFHVRTFVLADYNVLHNPSILTLLMYLITSRGYQFVIIFFVLSGFAIGSSVTRGITSNTFSWRQYWIHRLTRLWIVLIPAMILTFIWGVAQAVFYHTNIITNAIYGIVPFLELYFSYSTFPLPYMETTHPCGA